MVYDVGSMLAQFESAGIFEFVFPFLLIFALVFGILQKTEIFGKEGKTINFVIAFVMGLMSIRIDFVRAIFAEVTARASVGILILVMMLILISMFLTDKTKGNWYIVFSIVAVIVFIIILVQSFTYYGYSFSYFGGDIIGWIVGAVLLIGVIVAIFVGSGKGP